MSGMPIGLIIESLVAVLLLVTIGYCWTLNHRLKRLRADEESLRATISELITASEIAERAILGLKSTAGEADRTLGERLLEAERFSQQLSDQIGVGETVLGRITQIAEAAKPAPARAPADSVADHAAAQTAVAQPASRTMNARDLRQAAAETAARLERFRKTNSERAA